MNALDIFRIGLDKGQIPKILHKYWSVSSALRFLGNQKIMFSKYDAFNDPFECSANVEILTNPNDWVEYLMSQGENPLKAAHMAYNLTNDLGNANQIIQAAIEEKKKDVGIFCMTTENTNLLMWAHYADQHRGVCLTFDISKSLSEFCFPKKVNYTSDYLSYNYLLNQELATETLFCKSLEWSYENEYRIIKHNFNGLMAIDPQSLIGITFGCRCSSTDQAKIRNAASRFKNVQFYTAQKNSHKYRLDILNI